MWFFLCFVPCLPICIEVKFVKQMHKNVIMPVIYNEMDHILAEIVIKKHQFSSHVPTITKKTTANTCKPNLLNIAHMNTTSSI